MADQGVDRLIEKLNGFFEREALDIEYVLKKGLSAEIAFLL